MRSVGLAAAAVLLLALFPPMHREPRVVQPPASVEWSAGADTNPGANTSERTVVPLTESRVVDEMLRGSTGRLEHWTDVPELVILTSVMQYDSGASSEYVATSGVLTDQDVDHLTTELTSALRLLTGNTFDHFAAISRESVPLGVSARVIRPNEIVVGRYRDVQRQAGILGLGGRSVRTNGVITGAAVVLDDEYDRTGSRRVLLRTHELGHALGFKHVQSRPSIMNPQIGPEPTDLDRRIAAIAYGRNDHATQPPLVGSLLAD